MRRIPVAARPNATQLVKSQGLTYFKDRARPSDEVYWPDDRYYSFTSEEIELLEKATEDVYAMCCEAADYLIDHPEIITDKMAVPKFALEEISKSWKRKPAWGSIYGRFDVCFGGLDHPEPRLRVPKFYEFNADTPTTLIEAASIQWLWLEQTGHGNDQLNSLTERIIDAWRRNMSLIEQELGFRPTVHFTLTKADPTGEDAMTTIYLMDLCRQAGFQIKCLYVEQIRLSHDGRFYDQNGQHIDVIFKLYPWEWMVEQEFGEACFKDMGKVGQEKGGTIWIEAPYKMLWSSKALFAILWDLFKDDPRSQWLLPTYFENQAPTSLTHYARKPIFSREGADIHLYTDDKPLVDSKTGFYGREGHIIQELALLPEFKDEGTSFYPVLGLWVIDGEVGGMGIREDKTPITRNASNFIPHSISDGPINYKRTDIPDHVEIEASNIVENHARDKDEDSRQVLDFLAEVLA
jgi:glutathionylspermidine synthase